MLVVVLSVALLASLLYNFKLRRRMKGYEHVWEQIEQIADRNQDGSFTINIQHLDQHDPTEGFQAHEPTHAPGFKILDLDDLHADGTPPRAA